MKKLALVLGVACLLFVACKSNKPAEQPTGDQQNGCCEMTPEQRAEMEAFMAQWNDWANLTDSVKVELIGKAKACIDKRAEEKEAMKADLEAKIAEGDSMAIAKKAECEAKKAEFEAKVAEGDSMAVACAAKKVEMEAKWAAFETLTLDEQKALIDEKMECGQGCCKKDGCCKGEGNQEGCKKDGEHKCGEKPGECAKH
ncbi:MAG: hypothetical protein PHR20_05035 [Bacteroidales bacterium]|nr:hypothetical protein [Bacteroidales bacterium]